MDNIISFFNRFSDRPTPKDPVTASKIIQSALRQLDQIPQTPLPPQKAGALLDSLLEAKEATQIWQEDFNTNELIRLSRRIDEHVSLIRITPMPVIAARSPDATIQAVIDYANAHQATLFSKPYFRKNDTGLPFNFQVLRGNEPSIVVHTKEKKFGEGATMQTWRSHLVGQSGIRRVAKQTMHAKNRPNAIKKSLNFLRLFRGSEGIIQLKGYAIYPHKRTTDLKTNLIVEEAAGDMLDKKPKNDAERQEWEVKLLKGLTNIHSHGVVHYDIKRENLLMTDRGPVIGDFDIAQYESEPAKVKGTPLYYSPEISRTSVALTNKDRLTAERERLNITRQTDVFSLGLIFYQWKYNVDFSRKEVLPIIENWRNNLTSFKDKEEELIYQMLEDNPNQRITARDALSFARQYCS